MLAEEIKVGELYRAKVSNRIVTVRVDAIRENFEGRRRYSVTNLNTNRKITFRSAAKFREISIKCVQNNQE